MKTIEEKAKAYDEAFERAKRMFSEKELNYIFPELKESEDEEIKKWIIDDIRYNMNNEPLNNSEYKKKAERAIAWLEKQGEQKSSDTCDSLIIKSKEFPASEKRDFGYFNESADKTEPKFHEGDWTVSNLDGKARQISEVHFDKYNSYYVVNGMPVNLEEFDRRHHFWTIQDAKDGDVLSYVTDEEDLWIMIYWSLYEPYEGHVHYHALLINDDFSDKGTCCIYINDLKPATKEQRDLLFQKMHEAGYTFDFKKKELKKLKFKVGDEVITKNEESLTITRIDEEGYWSNDLFICSFDDSAEWELVEQKYHMTDEDKAEIDYCFT